jgi:hypothetical protein
MRLFVLVIKRGMSSIRTFPSLIRRGYTEFTKDFLELLSKSEEKK